MEERRSSKGGGLGRVRLLRGLNVLALVISFILNLLSFKEPFGGSTQFAALDKYHTLFGVPDWTFACVGLVFLAFTAFAVYQALPSQLGNAKISRDVGWLFVALCITNSAWLIAFSREVLWLSLVLLLLLMAVHIVIYVRLDIGGKQEFRTGPPDRLLIHLPFSLSLGWLLFLASMHLAAVAVEAGMVPGSTTDIVLSVSLSVLLALVGMFSITVRKDSTLCLVLAWGLMGVGLRSVNDSRTVSIAAFVAAGLLGVCGAIVGSLVLLSFFPFMRAFFDDEMEATIGQREKKERRSSNTISVSV